MAWRPMAVAGRPKLLACSCRSHPYVFTDYELLGLAHDHSNRASRSALYWDPPDPGY